MSASRRPDDEGSGVGGASAKGAVLIAAAVAVGIVLLGRGFDSGILPATSPSPSEQADDANDEPVDLDDDEDGATTTTDTTTSVATPPDQLQVIALNATGAAGEIVAGVAGAATTALQAAGYTAALEGANTTAVATSSVLFAPGFEADAAVVAEALGLPAASVAALPVPAPAGVPPVAQVAVVLGDDTPILPPPG